MSASRSFAAHTHVADDEADILPVIHTHAGRDATQSYTEIHAPSVLTDNLDPSKLIGELDTSTVDKDWKRPIPSSTTHFDNAEKPALSTLINTYDFEDVASKFLSPKTWAFYSSAATDCVTREANKTFFDRIWWRPRVLRNVRNVDTSSTMLGKPISLPLFVSPAALANLAHPDGELALARACEAKGIMQMISTNASHSIADIVKATPPTHPGIFQLYVNSDRTKTATLLDTVVLPLRSHGLCAVALTVDAAVPGKREADERIRGDETLAAPNSEARAANDARGGGIGRIMGAYIDPSLAWTDLRWLRARLGPQVPLLLKGVQGAADARLAMRAGLDGIIVGNHGGRSLDTSPPAVLILLEIRRECPEVFERMDVYVDGGVRRGTDILKCVCLGAKAVGIGRLPLYALLYGQEGVERLIELLRDELETAMRLVGITDLSQAGPELVNTLGIDHLVPRSAALERAWWWLWRRGARL